MAHFFVSRARKWAAKKFENCFKTDAEQRAEECFSFFSSSFRLPTESRMGADNTWWWGTAKNNNHSSSLLCRFIHSALLFFLFIDWRLSRLTFLNTSTSRNLPCRVHAYTNKILNRLRSAEDSQEQMSQFSMSNHSRMWSVHETLIATVSTFLSFFSYRSSAAHQYK